MMATQAVPKMPPFSGSIWIQTSVPKLSVDIGIPEVSVLSSDRAPRPKGWAQMETESKRMDGEEKKSHQPLQSSTIFLKQAPLKPVFHFTSGSLFC